MGIIDRRSREDNDTLHKPEACSTGEVPMTALSSRDYWAVAVKGSDVALGIWERMLDKRFDPHLDALPSTGEKVLKSREFEVFCNAAEVRAYAIPLIDDINGAAKVLWHCDRVEFAAVSEVRKDGTVHSTVSLQAVIEARATLSAALTVGGVAPEPQPSNAQKWIDLASSDDLVRDTLIHIGNEGSWYDLYKAYEGVEALAGRSGGLRSKAWAPDVATERNFTHTANCMRHNLSHSSRRKPPANPMPLNEARDLIQGMVHSILEELVS